jgi:hypothetical protein
MFLLAPGHVDDNFLIDFTHQNLLDYCSYIKSKHPFNIYSQQ